ncbi:MAG TPA: FGGY family carbohydrate kinase [Polyangiaceae bacterium]|nr:FGGY family carbohydrate kinase [Polyangiaceae bacterium]
MPLYLGLDSSTQSLTALVIDTDTQQVVLTRSVNFGADLPEYASKHGFLENPDPKVRRSNPLMWVAALEKLLSDVRASGFDWGTIAGISGAGQQHGSVYLNKPISEVGGWSTSATLVDQIRPLLSRSEAPIWMDSSTSQECRELAEAVGGPERVTQITGSRPIERFTAAQIRAFYKQDPEAYARTREIHLVSSFMASILAGRSAPIDFGDGAGMNLLDLDQLKWNPEMLEATAPELARRLLPAVASSTQVGTVAQFFVETYGFKSGVPVYAFTGDNPSSLVGTGAVRPGTAIVSLGTSDTVFAAMRNPRVDPRGYGHVFGNPAGGFMCLVCFANGSLARENVAQRVGLDWPAFEKAILDTPPGNSNALLLPYFVPEITPKILKPEARAFGSPEFVEFRAREQMARAVVEAQALAMQRYSDWIGETPDLILATGGASANRGILQILADVFGAEVRTLEVNNSSALGGALRAAQAHSGLAWEKLFEAFVSGGRQLHVKPNTAANYTALSQRFAEEVDRITTV